jgi:hypothetical protein
MPLLTDQPTPPSDRQPGLRIERRYRPAILLVVVAFLGFTGALESFATWGPFGDLQDEVTAYLDSSEKKAVEAFAIARGINAAVSFLKSADLSAVVAQVAPMQVLEPVDDLAKQFSDVMVVSIVSILVQRLILAVSQAWALTVVFPAGCLVLACSFGAYRSPTAGPRLAAIGRGIIMLALFGRFTVLAAGLVGTNLTDRFLASDLDASMTVMHDSGGNLDRFTAKVAPVATSPSARDTPAPSQTGGAPPTMLDQIKRAMRSTADTTQAVIGKGAALVNAASVLVPDKATLEALIVGLPGHIVKAIEIFLVQTLLTPLAVAFFLYGLLRGVLRPVPVRIETRPLIIESAAPPARA